jgi:hypothetical protein
MVMMADYKPSTKLKIQNRGTRKHGQKVLGKKEENVNENLNTGEEIDFNK